MKIFYATLIAAFFLSSVSVHAVTTEPIAPNNITREMVIEVQGLRPDVRPNHLVFQDGFTPIFVFNLADKFWGFPVGLHKSEKYQNWKVEPEVFEGENGNIAFRIKAMVPVGIYNIKAFGGVGPGSHYSAPNLVFGVFNQNYPLNISVPSDDLSFGLSIKVDGQEFRAPRM